MAAACAGMEAAAAAAATAVPPPSPPPSAAAAPGLSELVCAQGRNVKAVLCQRCGSRVLLPGAATFARRELLLPAMRKKAAAAAGGGGDVVREHWLVRDMFSFENVGFTRDVGNVKFLVCADCEAGPIGWHCLDDKDSFYVALERVAHE
ncbi:guanine nucleotide exchange factor MSS4 [Pezoporus wallicus]|uniref:guanine nucleotide exchange factor MSS4 n=1 Tax=Pezoporus wallicus TaxID=35540 RepID=UPI00254ABE9A|nr:guanine nucleotide exchange factor MSS4 [Pezoporus wallicus]XP_061298796.1 guanine nucleotide exchange factor MSS4 [Pezoporus flaviventris]